MPRRVSSTELDAVLSAVARLPEGGSIEEVRRALAGSLPRRTLQRRLAGLVAQERLVAEKRGRARRYRLPLDAAESQAVFAVREPQADGEAYVPLSREAERIRRTVREPIQHRRPVGHDRSFLERYRPNDTFYLPARARQHLLELGRLPGGEQLPAGTYLRQIFNRLLIDLSWNSSRLEGNTYSLLETERLLELGESAEGKDAEEAQMILNHKAAIELLAEQAPELGFNRYTILNLHALLADNPLDPQACGRLRSIAVEIAGTVYHPLEVPQLIEECFQRFLDTAAAIEDPFEQAFFAMVQLPYLQPFADVNKRVSRLAANVALVRRNLCPLSFVDVPQRAYVDGVLGVYELNRVELLRDLFLWAYERSCARYSAVRQSLGAPDPFRLRYRASLLETVTAVVRGGLDKKAATALIRRRAAQSAAPEDRPRFVEVAETELMSLHDGNIARFRLRPSEFHAWRETWR